MSEPVHEACDTLLELLRVESKKVQPNLFTVVLTVSALQSLMNERLDRLAVALRASCA